MSDRDAAVAEVQRAIVALGTARDFQKLQDYVLACTEPPEVLNAAIWTLLNDGHVRSAYLIAKLLQQRDIKHPLISFALFFGGKEMGVEADADEGRRCLRQQFDSQPPQAREVIYSTLEPLILQQIAIAYTRIGMTEEAEKTYRHVLQKDAQAAGAHYGLAFLLVRSGRESEAVPHLRAFLENAPAGREATEHVSHARETLSGLTGEAGRSVGSDLGPDDRG